MPLYTKSKPLMMESATGDSLVVFDPSEDPTSYLECVVVDRYRFGSGAFTDCPYPGYFAVSFNVLQGLTVALSFTGVFHDSQRSLFAEITLYDAFTHFALTSQDRKVRIVAAKCLRDGEWYLNEEDTFVTS